MSKGDHDNAIKLEKLNPNVQLFNFTAKHGFTRYSSSTGYVDKNGNSHFNLSPFIVK